MKGNRGARFGSRSMRADFLPIGGLVTRSYGARLGIMLSKRMQVLSGRRSRSGRRFTKPPSECTGNGGINGDIVGQMSSIRLGLGALMVVGLSAGTPIEFNRDIRPIL